MASKGSLGYRRSAAIERIEARCAELFGGQALVLPQRNRHGADYLLVEQLEVLATYLDSVEMPDSSADDYGEQMSLKELQALAAERGLDASKLRSKALVIALLDKAEESETVADFDDEDESEGEDGR